jgi:hypothetical protein
METFLSMESKTDKIRVAFFENTLFLGEIMKFVEPNAMFQKTEIVELGGCPHLSPQLLRRQR